MKQNKTFQLILLGACVLVITAVITTLTYTSQPTSAAANDTTVVLGGDTIRYASPAAADLNGNGYKEIVIGSRDGMLYVVAYNGSNWSKVWERQTANDINAAILASDHQSDGIIESPAAIADIDNDGDLEIVVTTGGTPNSATPSVNRNGAIIVYERESDWSFSVKPGWPFVMPDTMGQGSGGSDPDGVRDGIKGAAGLGDLDGDGDLEIVTISYDRRIRAFHHDGSVVTGWPIDRDLGDPILRGGDGSPAIGDIDNDGSNEVVVGTFSPPWNGDDGSGPFPSQYKDPDYTRATVWALNGDSSLVDGFPVITEQALKSSPALGDIDGDGDLEIVIGTGNFNGYINGQQVYAWHGDGSRVSGWPKSTGSNMLSSPALADLNEDGVLDVIIGCGDKTCTKLYAWEGDGSNLPGFPLTTAYTLDSPPVVADIDNDNKLEILQTTNKIANVLVIQHNGSNGSIDTSRSAGSNIWSTPLVDDLDNDGKMETVVGAGSGGQAAIFIYEETGTFDFETAPWPTFQHDMARTGTLLPPEVKFVSSITVYHQQGSGNTAEIVRTIQNVGGGEFDWTLNLTGTGGAVNVDVTSGTLKQGERVVVTLTIDTSSYAQDVWHDLGSMTLSAKYDGAHVNESPQTVPVTLFVGDVYNILLPMIQK
jgi:hypothetical protein